MQSMIQFLAAHLIPDHENTTDEHVRRAYGTLCGAVGIILNLLLFGGKYLSGMLTGSIAVMADAFNNLGDAGSSIITLLGIRMAAKKPDPHHPFGHGRLEYLSGMAVSILIIIVGLELGRDSLNQILTPAPVETGALTISILLASIAVKFYMYAYNRRIGQKINSPGMTATATDSLSDTISTFVVLLATIVSRFSGANLDGWGGILVATFIVYSGIKSTRETLAPLLGSPPEEEFVRQIEEIVLRHDEIVNIHDLIVHDYGPGRRMITLHAEVPGDGNIFALHDAVDSAEMELAEKLGCLATIHMDPISINDEKCDAMRGAVEEFAAGIDERITIHDFRIVDGPTHTRVIFDAVLPFDSDIDASKLQEQLEVFVRNMWTNTYPIITIDRPYHQ